MTTLWLIVLALLLATLLCLVPPLLRRTPAAEMASDASVRAFYLAQREQLRRDLDNGALSAQAHARADEELQRDLLQDLAMRHDPRARVGGQRASLAAACVLTVAVPVAAVLLYGQLGNPRAAATVALAQAPEPHAQAADNDMALAINALAQRLRASPDDADGWYVLARSYETLGRYNDAVAAYQEVLRLVPGQPAVLADLADALLSARQGQPDEASIAAVAQALNAEPDQPKALALAGMMALRRGDAAEALTHWERLRALLPPDSEAARQIQTNIAQARAMAASGRAGGAAAPPASGNSASTAAGQPATAPGPTASGVAAPDAAAPSPSAGASVTTARLAGQARIADALRDQVRPTDTVFILARPMTGSRMPVAILKMQAADLPRAFVLDDSTAMSPDATLSKAGKVRVEIRVSRSGNAAAQPGDLNGVLTDVGPRAEGLALVADTVVP
ncbi:c-type cytochrome biogenesis protein CcmI [Achromobacter mucicolens]|uniref:c-type cytochrome biogenesis protein CcmI n=1 Tax=Achromobacter mucicolens TaxID=1389922 RepID=UPI00244991D6|nr:c-type cytochrome biogenesis protein CcmI [Achromobacter mucicolens]MDH0094635.1 c-type cytochrome biogenesis protein CcmI [Achromobacter mucicolens]